MARCLSSWKAIFAWLALGLASGCATEIEGFGGANPGGAGGASSGGAGGAAGGQPGVGGSGASSTGGESTGGEGIGGTSVVCEPPEHACGGICVANTTTTGCYQSADCAPCPAAPANGVSSCSADGQCDFTCNTGYVENGSACECPQQCCSNADCGGGQTCSGGTCVTPCDSAICYGGCIIQGCLGGMCSGNTCTCICL